MESLIQTIRAQPFVVLCEFCECAGAVVRYCWSSSPATAQLATENQAIQAGLARIILASDYAAEDNQGFRYHPDAEIFQEVALKFEVPNAQDEAKWDVEFVDLFAVGRLFKVRPSPV